MCTEISSVQNCTSKVGFNQVRSTKIGTIELSPLQVGPIQLRA